jgi:hypothetical protein
MVSNDDSRSTVSGSEGSIHIKLQAEVITGYQPEINVLKGTYYRQTAKERVKRGEQTAKERVKTREYKIELLLFNIKLKVALVDSECW